MKMKKKRKDMTFFEYLIIIFCRDKGQKLYIGPWTLAEDVDWSKDE